MHTTTMTSSSAKVVRRSWADIVKKNNSETVAEVLAQPEPSSEVLSTSQQLPASEAVAELVASSEAPQQECKSIPTAVAEQPKPAAPIDVEAVVSELPSKPPGVLTANASEPSLKPGSRGSLACFCLGEVISMLSNYGWLWVYGDIDHPLAAKHFGKIYVHNKDVVEGHSLKAGDKVSFYLYSDNVGLGAEACRVEAKAPEAAAAPATFVPRAEAAVFVPRAEAAEFVPGASTAPVADMFSRMSRTFQSIPANGYVQMAGVVGFNSSYFDDSDSSDEEGDDGQADADKESLHDESDHSSVEGSDVVRPADLIVASAPWKKATRPGATSGKVKFADLPDRSTSPGMTSDSTNAGITSESDSDSNKLGVGYPAFRLPPGLEDLVPIPPVLVA